MFTGIVEAAAPVICNVNGKISIARPGIFDDIRLGSSIAVAGTCLSVVELDLKSMTFDIVGETLSRTTLGEKKKGDLLNLERAMRADSRFEGHMVQGHVEGAGIVESLVAGTLIVALPKPLLKGVVPKGSIALDGVSLTIADIQGERITVALIPLTLSETTLGRLRKGDHVNIETDVIRRYLIASSSLVAVASIILFN